MSGIAETKRGMIEALIVTVDQKISYYERERCGCDSKETVEKTSAFLDELNAGRSRLEALAGDSDALNVSGRGAVAPGSLVHATAEGDESTAVRWFVVPYGAGQDLLRGDERYMAVAADSPLGESLLGRKAGDTVELDLGDRKRTIRIDDIE